jgi:antitoxin ParD1/3/4
MSDIQKISVALTSEQLATLKAAVDTGEYATTSEIIREAIRDWQFKREIRQDDIRRLQQLWDEGKASGKAKPFDIERTISRAKSRLARPKGRQVGAK